MESRSTGWAPPTNQLGLLVRVKARSTWNRVVETTAASPIRVCTAVLLVVLIWLGLFSLFFAVFDQLNRTPLEATVAIPLLFNFFFLAMLTMLTFSNAIIAHGMLFSRREAEYLLAAPLSPKDVVTLKYMESLFLSSWSLVLLGLPLMIAMANGAKGYVITDHRVFYALFLAFFAAFIPIPGALGLLLAWVAARFFSRKAIRATAVIVALVVVAVIVWGLHALNMGNSSAELWIRSFLSRISFVESALLPNKWVAQGIEHAFQNKLTEALLYLAVTFANALFLSWLAVLIVSKHFEKAYDRASTGRDADRRRAAHPLGGFCGLVFFYLSPPLRLIAAKDLRTFFRDPLQWSQLVILFGLIILYLTNMPNLQLHLARTELALAIPFLNLCAISFILATFTCRFVFPLVSLEGQQLWLISMAPISRGLILRAKLAFAMTVSLLVTCGAMAYAAVMLNLSLVWTCIHLVTMVAVCYGLCGLAVGLGGRFPMFDQPHAARIANGPGGTVNLLASLALVGAVLAGVGYATWLSIGLPEGALPDRKMFFICYAAILVAIATGFTALTIGKRHFSRVEA